MSLTIECNQRADSEKPKALRREGKMLGVLYGHNGAESISLKMDTHETEALLRKAAVNKTVVTVKIPDISWNGKAILREVQMHPWKNQVYHVSFFSIADQDELEVTMPLNFTGVAHGVSQDGGVLDTVLTEMQLKCAPDNIPETLDINVESLGIGDALHIGDLVLPKGVTAVGSPEQVVVSVLQPRTIETVEEETETLDLGIDLGGEEEPPAAE
ncbi:MAG: 50S ribosomal protein L25/general stress protein Ctc [Leptolyngbya sp. SIO4C1]|nr:50S ribosomal protein L25/general stress protein Ctc [Leptolyngbya sp. SIO4C1]